MLYSCTFLFRNNLNDFLPACKKHRQISYAFRPSATVKDAIEAIGVPHVEVNKMNVNGTAVSFSYPLQPNDAVEVLPFETVVMSSPVAFVLDVHLGKLARLLRLLGIDTHYETDYADAEIVAIAVAQNRVVLTRDIGLLKHKVLQHGYWLRSQDPEEQLTEVVRRFALCEHMHPFSRCIACNGFITEVHKDTIIEEIPPDTKAFFHEFYQCTHCSKIYWKGSHYERMLRRIEQIRSVAC
ncbi:MAG TPA: Mut7-C RNAse domain-containing protein [Flavisolibacter sp.]|jgi:hypothetical protein|nr:Mut7-C RNAse domain-containing protein [Flavisolibacter sp.]